MISEYKDGSSSRDEMAETIQSGMPHFVKKNGNNSGEYILINDSGDLLYYDEEGLIFKAQPLY